MTTNYIVPQSIVDGQLAFVIYFFYPMMMLSVGRMLPESEISSEKSETSKKRKRCVSPDNSAALNKKCDTLVRVIGSSKGTTKIMRSESANHASIRKLFQDYFACLQSYDPAQYTSFFQTHCHENVLLSVLAVIRDPGSEQEVLGRYRQIMGREAAMSFLLNEQLCFPDGVVRLILERIELSQADSFSGAAFILHGKALFEGHRVYTLDATDMESAFRDAEAVESVLTGLATLATSCSHSSPVVSLDNLHTCYQKSLCDELFASADRSPPTLVTRSLDDKPVYISTSKARFSRCRLPKEYHCTAEGRVQLFLNAQLSIMKIKYYF